MARTKKAAKSRSKQAPDICEDDNTLGADRGGEARLLTCLPSPDPELDWRVTDDASLALPGDEALPESVDLREPWWAIRDQGVTGSCVGWAVADSVLRWHFVKGERIAPEQSLSARFVWMASKETDEFTSRPESFIEHAGTSLKAALQVVRKFGCVTEDTLPFEMNRLYGGTSTAFYMAASRFRINMFVRLNSIREWKQWLASRGPILIRVEVDRNWQLCQNGRLEFYDPFPGGHREGGHAAAIVGYTESGEFIVRNSWGKQWGADGFAFATSLYADKAVSEAWGVFV